MKELMFNMKKYFLSKKYNSEAKKQLPMYKLSFLDLQKEYNMIDEYQYELEVSDIINKDKSEEEKQILKLDIMMKYNKISNIEYCKQKNDLLNKPWVAIRTNPEISDDDDLEIEVVYNKTFIKKMKKRGLPGDTDEEIAEQWLKLFFLANSDDEENADDNDLDSESSYVKHSKLNDNSRFIG